MPLMVTSTSLARSSFRAFVQLLMPEFQIMPFHDLMIRSISRYALASDGRLNINLPPRHGKSTLCSILLPAWWLGLYPHNQIMHLAHSAELSNGFSLQVRNIVRNSAVYREVFPHFRLDPDRQRISDWRTAEGGGFRSMGVRGSVTGHGADLMIIDDPHKEGDADSLAELDKVYRWYASAARTRLSPGASIIFLMTRWHMLDLAGRVVEVEGGDEWAQIVLPALAEQGDLLGRAEGAALWPERFSRDALLRVKALDERLFQALYQNNPRGADDVLFMPGDFKRIEGYRPPDGTDFWTFDLATSASESADYTVCCRWYVLDGGLALAECRRFRRAFPDVRDIILDIASDYPGTMLVFPEDLVEMLMLREIRACMDNGRIISVPMRGDKRQKALPLAVLARRGDVHIHLESTDCRHWLDEVALFPDARFDDCVDCGSLAAHYLLDRGMIDWIPIDALPSRSIDGALDSLAWV